MSKSKTYEILKIKSNQVQIGDLIQAEGEWWKSISSAYKCEGEWCVDLMLHKYLGVIHPMSKRPANILIKRPI